MWIYTTTIVKLCGIHISVVVGILRMHVDYWHFEAVIEVSIVSTKLDSDLLVAVCDGMAKQQNCIPKRKYSPLHHTE